MSFFRRTDGGRWLVAGLGNPGERYADTRHNLGVMALEELLRRTGTKLGSHKSGCLIAETDLEGSRVVLARSTTYMNESGRPIGALRRWYKVPVDRLVVVYDEIDLPFGEVRIKVGGGAAGHNGVRSVIDHLGPDFVRIRGGVGRPRGRKEAADHVLATFSSGERKELPFLVSDLADAVEEVVTKGVERAMNEVNTRPQEGLRHPRN